ncbi:MAG: helix-turn-helix domain-containing protein [Deltaproteobacteria bacterium]|nr:helix-turn-helix domain-containing protein [Deltaproteobacteria bacterium]
MKQLELLSRVKGVKKRRDLLILLALAEGAKQTEVAQTCGLNKSTISRIQNRNKELLDELTLKANLATKAGRLRRAYREINKKTDSKKDLLDWLEYVRKEIEGDKSTVISNTIINKTEREREIVDREAERFREKLRAEIPLLQRLL